MGNQSEECGDWEILTFPPRLAAPRAARIAVGSRHPPLTIGKRKCQYCISRCMDNSHQLRDKTVCGGFGKRAVPYLGKHHRGFFRQRAGALQLGDD